MTHPASGNPPWLDWPSRETLISAAALERIEAALDARTPGAWQALTMQNSWQGRDAAQGTTTFYAPAARLLPSGLVEVAGTLFRSSGGAANGEVLAVLPTGLRPTRETSYVGTDSAGYAVNMIAKPNGQLSASTYRTTATTIGIAGYFSTNGPT